MTLKRTIHRRQARKRAKARRGRHFGGHSFLYSDWLTRETLAILKRNLADSERWRRLFDEEQEQGYA